MIIGDLTSEQIEYLRKLEKAFDIVYNCLGDDELMSSCNSEYHFDHNDVIRTDGSILTHMEMVTLQKGCMEDECIELQTTIRGATYLIVADRATKTWRYSLYVDDPFIVDKYDEIISRLEDMKKTMSNVEYYQNEYRDGIIVPNQYVIDEIRYIGD